MQKTSSKITAQPFLEGEREREDNSTTYNSNSEPSLVTLLKEGRSF
jgi:hypothetical protein